MYVEASAASNRAEVLAGEPKFDQLDPPLLEYCQVPLLLSTAMTAMPARAPASTSLICPATRSDTSTPALVTSSSLMFGMALLPSRTGASLTATTVMLTPSVSASAPPEPVFPWSLL